MSWGIYLLASILVAFFLGLFIPIVIISIKTFFQNRKVRKNKEDLLKQIHKNKRQKEVLNEKEERRYRSESGKQSKRSGTDRGAYSEEQPLGRTSESPGRNLQMETDALLDAKDDTGSGKTGKSSGGFFKRLHRR